MARTNKYASLNFNDIYDKKKNFITNNNNNSTTTNNPNPSSSSASNLSKTKISNSRIHGNMLVLSRPTPKPIISLASTPPSPPPQSQPKNPQPVYPDPTRSKSDTNSDSISLRPLGRTGGSAVPVSRDLCSVSPKPDRFVPPHLRPGYVCKEEKPETPAVVKLSGGGYRQRQFGEEGRPKSGGGGGGGVGGYERMRRGSGIDMYRPGSSGNRPNSSG